MAAPAALPFRDINVHASTSHYAFTSPSSPSSSTLVIDRPSGDIRLNDGNLLGAKRVSSVAGILGIIKLRLDKYIIVVTKTQPMGRLKGHMVYKVDATEVLPLREQPLHDPDEDRYLEYLKALLKSGPMYFSYTFDLTNSFQRQAQNDPTQPLWKRADDRFYWNRFVCSDLIDFRNGRNSGSRAQFAAGEQPGVDPYILPVMFGMLRITNTSVKGNPLTFVLITRRSRHRAGTRYFSRGIDDQGHVSNFNETEQTVILNDNASDGPVGYGVNGAAAGNADRATQVLSYVQTRGSVPVYWAEINKLKYTPSLQIRGVESAVGAARAHFDEQIKLYGDNYMVNLVNQKGREKGVKDAYEQMVKILVSGTPEQWNEKGSKGNEKLNVIESKQERSEYDRLHYIYFDFHNETKGLKWYRAQLLLDQLRDDLIRGQYFHGVYMPGDSLGRLEVRNTQSAVVRTNCMDCLDRTNVVQSMLGRFFLTRQLEDVGLLRQGENASDDSSFELLFRNVWADNADVVSKSYSGTGALKTDFTRTGERTRAGMFQDMSNSITRYVCNNFADGPRQDGFDLFLGAYSPDTSSVGAESMFVDTRPLGVQAVPYVLAGGLFFVIVSLFTSRAPEASVWPLRLLTLTSVLVSGYCAGFIARNGVLYVNWPKLNTPQFAQEVVSDAMAKIAKDPIMGRFVGHQRSKSDGRLSHLEEGKKRIE